MEPEYEMTYKEIAKELGLSRQTIAHIEKTALAKIRRRYTDLGAVYDRQLAEQTRESQSKES